jgi:hypothetical protein
MLGGDGIGTSAPQECDPVKSTGNDLSVLLSFNYKDRFLAEALRASLFVLEPNLQFFLSPASYGAVMFEENVAQGIYEDDAFLFLVGPSGVSHWQEIESRIALDRSQRDSSFSMVPVLTAGAMRPAHSFLEVLNWIQIPVVTDRTALRWLIKAIERNREPKAA